MNRSALSQLARRTRAPAITWLMQSALQRPRLISLAAGFTDNPSLPVGATRRLAARLLRSTRRAQPALQYGTTAGDPLLRERIAQHVRLLDGAGPRAPGYGKDQVVATHGSQQLLYLITEVLCDAGDIVLVEDPTYFVFLGILQSHGLVGRGIRTEPDGLDLAHLEAVLEDLRARGLLPRLKLLYLVSYFSNPAGTTVSLAKKQAALRLLRKYERDAGHPLYLLEDAAYRELRFAGEDIASAITADAGRGRVLYTSTFSKPFATGLRLGYGLLPEPVQSAVLRVKGNHDFGTTNFLQHLLSDALASGEYAQQVARLQARYARKAVVFTAALRQHLPPSVTWQAPAGGLYVWARFPKSVRTDARSALFRAALRHDVLYVPGGLCYADDPARRIPNHEMRLSFGSASLADLSEGAARLARALRRVL